MLTGATYTSEDAFGDVPRILWGEGSKIASGKEAWVAFQHNAAVCSPATTPTPDADAECAAVAPGTLAEVALPPRRARRADLRRRDARQLRPKLASQLDRATAFARQGDEACTAGDAKTASRRMKQAQKLLQKMAHRLSGLSARKRLDGGRDRRSSRRSRRPLRDGGASQEPVLVAQ
jgi:hypothetical protein